MFFVNELIQTKNGHKGKVIYTDFIENEDDKPLIVVLIYDLSIEDTYMGKNTLLFYSQDGNLISDLPDDDDLDLIVPEQVFHNFIKEKLSTQICI